MVPSPASYRLTGLGHGVVTLSVWMCHVDGMTRRITLLFHFNPVSCSKSPEFSGRSLEFSIEAEGGYTIIFSNEIKIGFTQLLYAFPCSF